jgi:hypothetical protein
MKILVMAAIFGMFALLLLFIDKYWND